MSEESFNWSPEQMLEVTLNQPDDFLKKLEHELYNELENIR